MIRKHCMSCGQDALHNESGKKDQPPRCVYCGAPVANHPESKKAQREAVRQQQVKKVRL